MRTTELPDSIPAEECTETTVLILREVLTGTDWIIATVAEHPQQGLIMDTAQPIASYRIERIDDFDYWAERITCVLAAHGWKLSNPNELGTALTLRLTAC